MLYSEILDSMTISGATGSVTVPEDWRQGRTIFGGLHVAFALRAMRALVPAEVPLRVLQATFVAPPVSETLSIQAQVLRTGKSAIHAEAKTTDAGQVACVATAVFGSRRLSRIEVIPRQRAVHSESPLAFPFIPGATPNFSKHFSMRWLACISHQTIKPERTSRGK